MRSDRHATKANAIRHDLLTAEGKTTREERARVLTGSYPNETREFLTKVRDASYRITREEVEALRTAGVSDDVIFELTVACAVGVGFERLDAAKRALGLSP